MLHGYDIKITDDDLNDSDKEDKKENWTEDGFYFIRDFIYGIEGTLYQKASATKETKKLLEPNGLEISGKILEFYLSQIYHQLNQKTNPLIVTQFIKIGKICDEKPLFMLILTSKVIKNAYYNMPRKNLDIESEEKYKKSVLLTLMNMKDNIVKDLNDSLKELKEVKQIKKNEIEKMENMSKQPKK